MEIQGLSFWMIGITIITYLYYKWITRNHDYFKNRGIAYKKPFLFLGSNPTFFFSKKSMGEFFNSLYNEFGDEKIIGMFDFNTPFYMIRDPEVIKKITVKDFDHFSEHRNIASTNDSDELFSKALSVLTGQKWKDMRTTLSPVFTGSKMRQMYDLIIDYADDMVKFICKNSESKSELIFDMKNLYAKYTNDIIATCAFGIKVNSLENPNNEFFKMGQIVMNPNKTLLMIKFTIMMYLPKLAKLLNISFISKKIENFFRSLIIDTMREREAKNIIRPDMIQLLMQLRKDGNLKHDEEIDVNDSIATVSESPIDNHEQQANNLKPKWTDDYLIAQCLIFFFAGFETSANLLAVMSHDIATNPNVQEKLLAEIDEIYEKTNGKLITYNDLQSMKYLDMVISETLRKWPPAPLTDRACIKDYKYTENDETKFIIEKGQYVWIPVIGLHMNSKYFPNPEQYDPERFNEENISKIVSGSYIPFGMGPRSCIASRFALMSVKTIIVQLLRNFTFERCEKTVYPMKMGKFSLLPDEGIHLALKPRVVSNM